jgi:hypothetical protein
MSDSPEEKGIKKVRFLYSKPEETKPIYVNGIYGGMTPRGDLLCHFFYEYHDIAKEDQHGVKDGRVSDLTQRIEIVEHKPSEIVFRREIRASIIIPAHQISGIANWMLDKFKSSGFIVEKEEKE